MWRTALQSPPMRRSGPRSWSWVSLHLTSGFAVWDVELRASVSQSTRACCCKCMDRSIRQKHRNNLLIAMPAKEEPLESVRNHLQAPLCVHQRLFSYLVQSDEACLWKYLMAAGDEIWPSKSMRVFLRWTFWSDPGTGPGAQTFWDLPLQLHHLWLWHPAAPPR